MGYVIEKRIKGTPKWTKAAELKSPYCKGTADNLEEGVEYEFRVRAVNEGGPGEPSAPSQSVITKPRKCKFFLFFFFCKCLYRFLKFICFLQIFFFVFLKVRYRRLVTIWRSLCLLVLGQMWSGQAYLTKL